MGYNSSGQLGDGTTNNASLPICVASNVVAIAAGSSNSLFLKVDGTLWAMGKNRLGQLGDGTTNDANLPICVASNVAAVAAGYNHSLLVKTDGTLWAMGYNVNGQLGKGDFTSTNRPINVASNVVAVAAGYNHSLFLKTDGIICAMGANSFGQLGNGTTTITNRPINVSSISSVGNVLLGFGNSSLAIGAYLKSQVFISLSNLNQTYTGSACAVTVSTTPPGMPVDLTYNGFPFAPTNAGVYTVIGSVHDTTNYYSETAPVTLIILPVGLTDQALAVGEALNLSVAAGDVSQSYQWFKDSRLLWGATNSALTVAIAGVTDSGIYFVVITNGGGVVISRPASVMVGNPCLLAWGKNRDGQLGDGTTSNAKLPIPVASNVVAGAAGVSHSLFVTQDGTLWAMGTNKYGQLGNGTFTSTYQPIYVASNVVAVAAGAAHSVYVKTDGTLWAMGADFDGQLGDGTYNNTNRPTSVASNVVAVAAGYYYSLFVKTDGTLWTVGYNSYGQLGNGTSITYTNRPINVASNVVAVAAGYAHSLFMKTDGTLWGMGYNNLGQLGNGTSFTSTNRPINLASNVVAMVAGDSHSLFVKTDGTLWALGDKTNIAVLVASNVVAEAGGSGYSLFTKADGTTWASGYNAFGQLGVGTTNNAISPIKVSSAAYVANIFPAGIASHTLAAGNINSSVIVTLDNLNRTYTGSAINITTNTTPPGLPVDLTYNGFPDTPTNPGIYTVIGTINNPYYFGSTTNILTVGLPPISLTTSNNAGSGQQLGFQLTGLPPNYPCILQGATNLTAPINWQPILTNYTDASGNWSFTASNLPAPNLFYRITGQ